MELLRANLKHILAEKGSSLADVLSGKNKNSVQKLTVEELQQISNEVNIPMADLLSYHFSVDRQKLKNIKLLILDVDGVMTDAGMYFTQKGDQIKKYNSKDGMAILALPDYGIEPGIISSGFAYEMVKSRADVLKIKNFYIGREPKIKILEKWCERLNYQMNQVAMIGDDINDLEVMRNIGFSACPADAVPVVKKQVDLVLQKRGGEGCVREFIDHYLLEEALER